MDRPRRDPETISVDPTVLIERSQRPSTPTPEPIEPTVAIDREDVLRHLETPPEPAREPARTSQPPRRQPPPVSDPTVLIDNPHRPAPPQRRSAPAPRREPFLARLKGLFGGAPVSTPRARSAAPAPTRGRGDGALTPAVRGAALALGAVVVAGLLLFAAVQLWDWMFPSGQKLTIVKPDGGTIVGGGIDCGTRGSTCEVEVATGEPVELRPEADAGYVFREFLGDCPNTGRLILRKAMSCSAVFDKVALTGTTPGGGAGSVTWDLTIDKPTNGSIVASPYIDCGTVGDTCTAKVPDGTPVTLVSLADKDFELNAYTGDCAPNGETIMGGARRCGATFRPREKGALASGRPDRERDNREKPPQVESNRPKTPPVAGNPPPKPSGQGPGVAPPKPEPTPPTGQELPRTLPSPPPPEVDPKKPPQVISEEDHAKNEISALMRAYCNALSARDANRMTKIFPRADRRVLGQRFGEYKSVKCTLTEEPKWDRLDVRGKDGAAGAQITFGMKQAIVMRSGGTPSEIEQIVRMVLSRESNQTAWVIDDVKSEMKPK